MSDNLRARPTVSVILPVFNGAQFIEQAVISILQQSFSDFEFIIIDDGSTDGTTNIVKRLADTDERVILIVRENRGLVASLNEGIAIAKGEFIARMDADDIALPERFAKQIDFLRQNGYDLCGTSVQCIGKTHHLWRYPSTPEEVEVQLLFDSPYAHPTVMCKASILKTLGYCDGAANAEDYDLWQRAWHFGAKGANLNEVLLQYRVHNAQVSHVKMVQQRGLANSVRERHWQAIAGRAHHAEIKQLLEIFGEKRGDLATIKCLLQAVLHKYQGVAQVLFSDHAYRIGVKAAYASRRPWAVWRDILEGSETGRSKKQELGLFAIWALGFAPQGYLYEKTKSWYLRWKWR